MASRCPSLLPAPLPDPCLREENAVCLSEVGWGGGGGGRCPRKQGWDSGGYKGCHARRGDEEASWAHRDKTSPALHCGFVKPEAALTYSQTVSTCPETFTCSALSQCLTLNAMASTQQSGFQAIIRLEGK